MELELISIICTVKNGQKTLSSTIESVLAQTYTKWEFIIVDDGSTDNTNEILKEYSLLDKRIFIILTDGIGRGNALNKAIEYTKGNYICNIDADDLMHPDKLMIQYRCMKKNPGYFLITSDSEIIYGNEMPLWKDYNTNHSQVVGIDDSILIDNQVGHSSVIIEKKSLLNIGCYDPNRKSQLDYDLWLRAFCKKYRLGKINNKLTAKRIHKNQSYENKKRIAYLYRNTSLKIIYILKYNKKKYRIIFAIILFILGLLPFKVRKLVRTIATQYRQKD